MRKVTSLLCLLALLLMNLVASAQEMTPEEQAADAAETRQAVFELLRFHMGPITAMARGRLEFNAALAQRNAERIAQLGAMIPDVFERDTRGFDVETIALDKIWDNKADFEMHAAELVKQAEAFAAAAASGDRATTLQALRPLGGACGNCHDNYRRDP